MSDSVTGSFTATGQSSQIGLRGNFNISLSGFGTATVALQRSFDDGSSWKTVEEFTADAEQYGFEPEAGVVYRFNCSAYTSGTIAYRLSK